MNLYARISYLAEYQPSKIAVESPKQSLTYSALDRLIRQIAALLRASGVGAGDIVGVHLRDTPTHIAAFFACMRLGAPILPLDWRAARYEFDRVVARFAPKAVLDDQKPSLD